MHEIDVQKKKQKQKNICKHDRPHLKCTVPVRVSLAFKVTRPTFLIFTVHIYGNIKTKTSHWFYSVTKIMIVILIYSNEY